MFNVTSIRGFNSYFGVEFVFSTLVFEILFCISDVFEGVFLTSLLSLFSN